MRSLTGIALALLLVPVAAEEKGIDHWISLLEVGDVAERRAAAYEIWKLQERGGRAAVALAYALSDADDYVRETAARALEIHIRGAVGATAPLEQAVRDKRVAVRRDAARLLAMVGPGAFDAMGSLLKALHDTAVMLGNKGVITPAQELKIQEAILPITVLGEQVSRVIVAWKDGTTPPELRNLVEQLGQLVIKIAEILPMQDGARAALVEKIALVPG